MRVLVAGASGFIGTAVTSRLVDEGHEVVRLVRRRAHADDEVSWSPASGIVDFTVMDRVDAVLNLSGASLTRLPWSRRYRDEIMESRVAATRTLADAMRKAASPPEVFLSGSAVGIYGDRPGELLTEHSVPGEGFLAEQDHRAARDPLRGARGVGLGGRRLGDIIEVVIGHPGGAVDQEPRGIDLHPHVGE